MTNSSDASHTLARLFGLFDREADRCEGFLVAYSGGLDSHCLLCLTALWRQSSIRFASFPLEAIHVDHGLQSDSALWAQRCQQTCDQLGLALNVKRVDVSASGSGPEAAARDARYVAFELLAGSDVLLLQGHHASDQAETVLYRLCLGHGAEGLKGMPESRSMGRGRLFRPLLATGLSRQAIAKLFDQLSRQHGWPDHPVVDPSNERDEFSRNYLRHHVLPLLEQRWPSAINRIASSAAYLADSVALNRTLARLDLKRLTETPIRTLGNDYLAALPFTALIQEENVSAARLTNVFRYWLGGLDVQLSEKAMGAIVSAALASQVAADTKAEIQAGIEHWLTLYRQTLFLRSITPSQGSLKLACAAPEIADAQRELVSVLAPPPKSTVVSCRLRSHPLLSGSIMVEPAKRGRRCTLKRLLSEAHVLPWQRDSLPVIFYGQEPVCIPGVFVAKSAAPAAASESVPHQKPYAVVLRYSIQ